MAFTCASTTSRTSTQPKDIGGLPCFMRPSSKLHISLIDSESFLLETGGPTVKPGNMETSSGAFGCSLENFHAAFSDSTLERAYDGRVVGFQSFSSYTFSAIGAHEVSVTAFAEDVITTRLTPALRASSITSKVPLTAGSISSFFGSFTLECLKKGEAVC